MTTEFNKGAAIGLVVGYFLGLPILNFLNSLGIPSSWNVPIILVIGAYLYFFKK